MAKDPVCGMEIDSRQARQSTLYAGNVFHFCSEDCQVKFKNNPERYTEIQPKGPSSGRKVVVVGTGQVGATISFAITASGLASTIVLVDVNAGLAEGHAMDLNHGLPFVQPARIFAGEYADCQDADLVIVAAGTAQNPGETRLDLVRKNTEIFKDIIPKITAYEPHILLVVSNPVDILTYVTLKISNYSMNRIIGSGTTLDTARFRFLLSRHCRIDTRNVHGYIIGEHGDSEVPVWSLVNIAGMSIGQFSQVWEGDFSEKTKREIFGQAKNAAYEIIGRKGYTNFAIALAVERIAGSILRDENSVLTVSSLLDQYHGVTDVCLSVPAVVNLNGISRHIELKLDDIEAEKLRASAQALKRVIAQLNI